MRRRDFISMLGGATATWPLMAHAQQTANPVIGFLSSLAPSRLSSLSADLVRRNVAVIAAISGTPAALAAKAATTNIPIVFAIGGDPITSGLVSSLGHPSGNVTGVSFYNTALVTKRLELARELVAKESIVGMLVNPENKLIVLMARHALPTVFADREQAEAGGLISYGASRVDAYRQAGEYVGRIIKGAKTSELPVILPTKFHLLINLKTAKSLHINIPATVLSRADEVIE
jgi:putative ABC transport system substrate-binding protein